MKKKTLPKADVRAVVGRSHEPADAFDGSAIEDPGALLDEATRPIDAGGRIDLCIDEPLRFVIDRLRERAMQASPAEKTEIAKEVEFFRNKLKKDRYRRRHPEKHLVAHMSPERATALREYGREKARKYARDPKRRQAAALRARERRNALSGDEMLRDLDKERQRANARLARMSPEQRESERKKRRDRRANRTPEQRSRAAWINQRALKESPAARERSRASKSAYRRKARKALAAGPCVGCGAKGAPCSGNRGLCPQCQRDRMIASGLLRAKPREPCAECGRPSTGKSSTAARAGRHKAYCEEHKRKR